MVIGAFAAIAHEPELQRERERDLIERECWSLEEEICYAASARSDAAKPKKRGRMKREECDGRTEQEKPGGYNGKFTSNSVCYKCLGLEICALG